MGGDFARAFVSFFAIIDPVGNVLVFYLLTHTLARSQQLLVAIVSVATAGALLVLFSLGGQEVLEFLGISQDSFKAAAGFLLLLPAYRLVEQGQPMAVDQQEAADPVQMALVPLATPLLAGPGALATSISLSETLGPGTTILAIASVLVLSFALFAGARWLFVWLGPAPLRLSSRLVGILLFAIAVDLILEGLDAFFQ